MLGSTNAQSSATTSTGGYVRAVGVPNGKAILAAAPDITVLGTVYKPIWLGTAMNTFNTNTFTKTGTGVATGADAYVFSDEDSTNLHVGTSVAHTFDTTKDFSTNAGFKCRYYICYAEAANVAAAAGIAINLYNYHATFEFIGGANLKLSSDSMLFGYSSTNYTQIQFIDLSLSSFYNNATASYFCMNCTLLQTILLPDTLLIFNNSTLTSCSNLTKLHCNITTINGTGNAISWLYNLKELNLPYLTTIPSGTYNLFDMCYALTSALLPSLVNAELRGLFNRSYKLSYFRIADTLTTVYASNTSTLAYCRFIGLPNNFNISGCNFSGAVANGVTKSLDWLNNELPSKLADRSATTAGTMIIGTNNIALFTAATIAHLTAFNWSFT